MRRILKSVIAKILTIEARATIAKYKPSIIAVTGSVGKTSTKDALYAALADHAFIRKSEKSFNSEIGIPLTVIGIPNGWMNPLVWIQNLVDGLLLILFRTRYPDWLVLEVGADRPGDIRDVAEWLPVDIAIITRLPDVPVHVEYFESTEALTEEKAAIISALKPSGTLILCADDERVMRFAERAAGRQVLTFGFSPDADVCGEKTSIIYSEGPVRQPIGMQMTVRSGDEAAGVNIVGAVGHHTLLPLLAAVAAARTLNVPLKETVSSFERNFTPTPGRMRLVPGVKHTSIIDDSYNASPAATEAALQTLEKITAGGRRIAMIGDMLELGRHSVEEHRKMGALAGRSADILVTVGFRARDAAESARGAGLPDDAILQFEDSAKAGEELAARAQEGDVFLVKGSQSVRMERAVKALMAEPQLAEKMLVRQEAEWQQR